MTTRNFIDETIAALTPTLLADLDPTKNYSLEKTASKHQSWFVIPGNKVFGTLSIVNVAGMGKPGVRVRNPLNPINYLRTSPVLGVRRLEDGSLELDTESGTYLLKQFGTSDA